MKAITGYPDPGALSTEPVGWVYWNNSTLPASSITVSRSLGAGLPSQVAGTDDMVAAEATVVVSTRGLVAEGLHSPWDTGLPKLGDAMDIYSGLVDKSGVRRERRILRGRVDSVEGDVTDPSVTVRVIDRVDRLRKQITLDPLSHKMPPLYRGGAYRYIGLHPTYLTDLIGRNCGFYATPPKASSAWVSAPMVGSLWPEQGELETAGPVSPGNGAPIPAEPEFAPAQWGLAVTNARAFYVPVPPGGATSSRALTRPFYVRFLASGPNVNGRNRIILRWPDFHQIHIRFGPAGLQIARFASDVSDSVDLTTGANYINVPAPAGSLTDGADVSVWLIPTVPGSTTGADVNIRAQIDVPAADTVTSSTVQNSVMWGPATMHTTDLEQVRTYSAGSDGLLGGVQMGSALNVYDLHAWSRTAEHDVDAGRNWIGMPSLVDENCLDLLKRQAKQELSLLWLDEDGRLRYRSRIAALNAPSRETITVSSIKGLKWRRSWDSVAEVIKVSHQMPNAIRGTGRYPTQHVWQGSLESIDPLDSVQYLMEPPANEDWIQVDPVSRLPTINHDPADVAAASQIDLFKAGHGSWMSTISEHLTDPEAMDPTPRSWYPIQYAKITPRLYRLTVNNLYDARILTTRSPDWAGWRSIRRALPMPLLRAYKKVKWEDVEQVATLTGPLGTGEYIHDAGWMVQVPDEAQDIADYLAVQMTTPTPVYEAVEVAPDDRRQLGDVVTLDDSFEQRRCLILSIEDDYPAPGERTQVLSLKPI